MPPAADVQTYMTGAWRLMTGRPDGMRAFDLSADGFWTSFHAITVALPALLAGWVPLASDLVMADAGFAGRLGMVVRLAVVDIATWVVPIALFALAARHVGLADRFVAYVVASNWGSALLIWLTVPVSLVRLFAPQAEDTATGLALVVALVTVVLMWRLTNVVINRGPAVASGVFVGIFAASFAVLFLLQGLLGIHIPQ